VVTVSGLLLLGLAAMCWPPPAPWGGGLRRGRVGSIDWFGRLGFSDGSDRRGSSARMIGSDRQDGPGWRAGSDRRNGLGRRPGVRWRLPPWLVSAQVATAAGALLAGLAIAPVAGLAAGVAAAMVTATTVRLSLGAVERRRSRRLLVELSGELRLLARELAAGATVPAAVAAATETDCRASDLLIAVAAEARSMRSPSGDAAESRRSFHDRGLAHDVAAVATRLRSAWQMAARYGVPLARVIRSVSDDVDDRRSQMDRRATSTAGPTLSGYLLAGLPAAGLALGTAMGAHPFHILTSTTVGGLLLLVGTLLTCTGLLWSDRIARA
jgi:tight adherence protein B